MPPPQPAGTPSWSWACVWCGRRRRRKTGGAGHDNEDGAGASGRGDRWSLFIDLPVLEAATAGFSDSNLLGRGGFGPVYKASSSLSSSSLLYPSCALPSPHLDDSQPLLADRSGRAGERAGDRGEAAVAGVAAGGAGVPQRGAPAAQGAAPQPRLPPRLLRLLLLRRRRRDWHRTQDARLPILPQRQPRPLPLRQGEEGGARLAKTVPDNRRASKGSPLSPRRISGEDHPQGHQGQQRAPRREAEPEDLGLRHGQALPGRRHAREHLQDLRHIWLHGSRVRDERVPLDEDRRFQLRDARAGDRQREEEHRPASRRRKNRPPELHMEAVGGRPATGDRGRGPLRRLGRRRGGDVRAARAAVLPGRRVGPAGHVQRAPHAVQRLLHAAQAREAGDPRPGRPVDEHYGHGVGGVQLRIWIRHEYEQHVRYRHNEGLDVGEYCRGLLEEFYICIIHHRRSMKIREERI